MKHERPTEELRELAALHALGALTQREADSFELHIGEGCSVCESEGRKFRKLISVIGMAGQEANPPDYIRDLLAARVEREPQAKAAKKMPDVPVEQKKQVPRTVPVTIRPQNRRASVFPWVLAVILLLLGLGAAYAWKLSQDASAQLQAQLASSQTDLRDLRARVEVQKEDAGSLDRVLSMIGKPGARIARLAVQTVPPAFSAALVWDTEKGNCLLLGAFPPAPEGKVYQLWLFTPQAKISAGAFKTSTAGLLTMPVPQEAANAGAAVITLEPDNGSQIPTSPYYAVGRIE